MSYTLQDIDIRIMMTDVVLRKRIKALSLTESELDIVYNIEKSGSSSSELAKVLCRSVNTVSVTLNKLRRKGYLTREVRTCNTGGKYYVYFNIYSWI